MLKGSGGNSTSFKKGDKPPIHKQNCHCFRCSKIAWAKGLTITDERIKNIAKLTSKRMKGKKREQSIRWGGGRIKEKRGYILVYSPNHLYIKGIYVYEHHLIMEKKLGRYLTSQEVVHHIDFDKSNNNINNLYLFNSQSEHQKYHKFLRNCVKEALNENLSFL